MYGFNPWIARIDFPQIFDTLSYINISQHIWFYSPSFKIVFWTSAAAKSLQSCPTLCDPIDGSPPGSSVPGILQARTLEWVAISFSSAGKWKVKVKSLSHVWLFVTPWTEAYQAPPSMGFSRQMYWSGLPLPSPFGHLDVLIWYQGSSLQSCFLIISALLKSNPSRIYRNPSWSRFIFR